MSIALPLGLLGLLGIVALIIIHLLHPNYQQKFISTTYVWKRSLKYKKKRIPISRLRNIILIICQILIITACAIIMCQPIIAAQGNTADEKVFILDASASMRTENGGQTRFARGVSKVMEACAEALKKETGAVSVILATEEPEFIIQRAGMDKAEEVSKTLEGLLEGDSRCGYATANTDKAVELAELVLEENPEAQVFYYTGTSYLPSNGSVKLVSVAEEGEWNAAILDVQAKNVENRYNFEVETACYGTDEKITVVCVVSGANEDRKTVTMEKTVLCTGDEAQTVSFVPEEDAGVLISAYDQVRVYIQTSGGNDSLLYDNEFYLYGGRPQKIKIQYVTYFKNPFMTAYLNSLRDSLRSRWDIDIKVCSCMSGQWDNEPETSGYDLYLYENVQEQFALPTDGVIFLMNPLVDIAGGGYSLGNAVVFDPQGDPVALTADQPHAIMNGVNAANIMTTKYTYLGMFEGYTPLMMCGDDPVLLIKETDSQKILLSTLYINYSLPISPDYARMIYNAFDYFMPPAISNAAGKADRVFEINDTAVLNSRGESLTVSGGLELRTEVLPYTLKLTKIGTYTLTQESALGSLPVENFFVRLSPVESNITRVADPLAEPVSGENGQNEDVNLIFFFAIALAVLLGAEWLLHSREHL